MTEEKRLIVDYGGFVGVWHYDRQLYDDRRRFDRLMGSFAAAHRTVRRFCILCAKAVLQ